MELALDFEEFGSGLIHALITNEDGVVVERNFVLGIADKFPFGVITFPIYHCW